MASIRVSPVCKRVCPKTSPVKQFFCSHNNTNIIHTSGVHTELECTRCGKIIERSLSDMYGGL